MTLETIISIFGVHWRLSQSLFLSTERESMCVSFVLLFNIAHIIQREEQVPGPITTEGMFLSDHQDVYSLFG